MYNSSTKKLKAVLVAILAIVLLVNAVLPMTVMGSSKKNTGDYQYYVIKSGDTLTRIAKTHGVTVSDIMTRTPKMVSPRTKITEIQNIMHRHKIHSVLVTDKEHHLLGIVDSYAASLMEEKK